MAGQWGQWQMQLPANSFNQKQPATIPETRFFSIDRQWQKSLTPQKNLIPASQVPSPNKLIHRQDTIDPKHS
jgi:hypothetical protein